MNEKRFEEIDIMRVMGFLMVVDQHILGAYAKLPETKLGDALILHFLYLVGRPAVPMFIAITGFTLFYANYDCFKLKSYYEKRLKTIAVPYLFWSLASIIIFQEFDKLRNLLPILATGTASYHLWYMGMSIRLYILFPVILALTPWILRKSKAQKSLMFIAFCIFYWVIFKEKNFLSSSLAAFFFGSSSGFPKIFIEYDPIFWSIYFVCGAIVFFRYEAFKAIALKYSKLILISYIPLLSYMYYTQISSLLPEHFPRIAYEHGLYTLFMLHTSVIMYIAALKLGSSGSPLKRYMSRLGMLSFGAYLVHVIVLQQVANTVRWIIPTSSYLISGLLIFILTSVISFGICYLIAYLPFSKYIIGIGSNRR